MGFRKIFNLWDDGDAIRDIDYTTASNSPYEPLGGVTRTYYRMLRKGAVIAPGASCYSPLPISLNQDHVAHEFRYPSASGGILVALSSADLVATDDIEAMQTYIIQHADAVYKHCHRRLGAKDSLYIITGCIKSDLWALAAYQEVEGHGNNHIRLLQLSRAAARMPDLDRPSSAYHWTQQPTATYPDHDDSGVEGLKNQSLFLQGFKLTFSDRYVSRMKGTLSASSGNRSTPTATQDSHGQSEYGGAASGGDGEEAPSQGGGCGPSEGGSMPRTRSLPTQESTTSSHEAFHGMDQSDYSSSAGQCLKYEEAMVVDGCGEIEYSQFPVPSGNRYHPSDIINQTLLNHTGADVALSHDDDWRYLFRTEPSIETNDSRASASHDECHPDLGGPSSMETATRAVSPGVVAVDRAAPGSTRSIAVRAGVAYLQPPSTDPGDPSHRADAVSETKDSLPSASHDAKLVELKVIPEAELDLIECGHSQMWGRATSALIAAGGHADIFKAKMKGGDSDGKLVVVKVFREAHLKYKDSPEGKAKYINRLRREYAVWGMLNHPNIIPLNGLVIHVDIASPGLVSDFKVHKDLAAFSQRNGTFDRLHMAKGVACGLKYLHGMRVVHGDLTLANILVDQEAKEDGTIVFFPLITDFGKSRVLEKEGYTTQPERQLLHQPPELLRYRGAEDPTTKGILTLASDVYSFALVLLELITGKIPYSVERLVRSQLYVAWVIADPKIELRPTPEKYPILHESYEFCWPILAVCWKTDKDDRITSGEAYDRLCTGATSKRGVNGEK